MNPKVIEAARYRSERALECVEDADARVRRVLRAQAECVSDAMVHAAVVELAASESKIHEAMRAAIAAALLKEAEE